MDSDLVVKVKYGDTLRRFSVTLNGNSSGGLDMAGLRTKILHLFKFTPDVNFTIIYVDEDDDMVTLVDDTDLSDAIKQRLNPLRIIVYLNSGSPGSTGHGNSTPIVERHFPQVNPNFPPTVPPCFSFRRQPTPISPVAQPLFSPNGQQLSDLASKASSSTEVVSGDEQSLSKLFQYLASKVANVAPEQYHDFISKLSDDVSKAASTSPIPAIAPVIFELIETLVKVGISHQDPISKDQISAVSKEIKTDSGKSEDHKISDMLKTSKDQVAKSEALSNANLGYNAGNLPKNGDFLHPQYVANIEPSNDIKNSRATPGSKFTPLICRNNFGKMPWVEDNGCLNGKETRSNVCVLHPHSAHQMQGKANTSGASQNNEVLSGQMGQNAVLSATDLAAWVGHSVKGPQKEFDGYPNGTQISSSVSFPPLQVTRQNSGSVTEQMGPNASNCVPSDGFHLMPPRTYLNCSNAGRVFHQGVQCDGCGASPITGPRYKSKVKVNYDLCSICFADLGNEADYTRMDHPRSYRSSRLAKFHHPRIHRHLYGLRSCGLRSSYQAKLDSRFMEDVNIFDGTAMAPLTPFTKIWRMQNNGTVAWPRGTQLVWIGGDKLTKVESFEVELPVEGCLVGMDLNVAVEFTAPGRFGQFVSYWRMALPSGEKFGQCVWVLIRVDTPGGDYQCQNVPTLNLNLPPDNGDLDDQIINAEGFPVVATHPDLNSTMAPDLVKPIVNGHTSKDMEAVSDDLINCNDNSLFIPQEVPAAVSYPLIDLTVDPCEPAPVTHVHLYPGDASGGTTLEPTPIGNVQLFPGEFSGGTTLERTPVTNVQLFPGSEGTTLEQSLLKELDEMGFKEIDLNRKILQVNDYDIARSLDDLCVAEWDPMLEELKEMGFDDKETNRKLLAKNGGSIKRVVKDLIAAEKAQGTF